MFFSNRNPRIRGQFPCLTLQSTLYKEDRCVLLSALHTAVHIVQGRQMCVAISCTHCSPHCTSQGRQMCVAISCTHCSPTAVQVREDRCVAISCTHCSPHCTRKTDVCCYQLYTLQSTLYKSGKTDVLLSAVHIAVHAVQGRQMCVAISCTHCSPHCTRKTVCCYQLYTLQSYCCTRKTDVCCYQLYTLQSTLYKSRKTDVCCYQLYTLQSYCCTSQGRQICLLDSCYHASNKQTVFHRRICLGNCRCCHTDTEVTDQTHYPTQILYTVTRPTSPPLTLDAKHLAGWPPKYQF